MNIALMAHDRKKELMVQFCIAYCGILAEHSVCATNTTGKLVSEATGLPVTLYLHADQGGAQQIGARIAYNEIDLVLFFCDPANPNGFDDINMDVIAGLPGENADDFKYRYGSCESMLDENDKGKIEA